jgi:hypothetical protein
MEKMKWIDALIDFHETKKNGLYQEKGQKLILN